MKDSLAKAGIDLEIKRITAAEVLNRRVPGTTSMPFFSTSINSIVLDSGYKLLAVAHSKGVANWNAYSNPKLDATIDALLAERDDARYVSLVGEAQRLFAECEPDEVVRRGRFAVCAERRDKRRAGQGKRQHHRANGQRRRERATALLEQGAQSRRQQRQRGNQPEVLQERVHPFIEFTSSTFVVLRCR